MFQRADTDFVRFAKTHDGGVETPDVFLLEVTGRIELRLRARLGCLLGGRRLGSSHAGQKRYGDGDRD